MSEVITFGCRLNTYESEVIKSHLKDAGLEKAIVFNTCAVTKEAERQARQEIRKFKRLNPEAHVIVTGCSAQVHPEIYKNMPEVSRVIGNTEKLLKESYLSNDPLLMTDIMAVKETAGHLVTGFENKARAFLQVQNGCNHRCTFCIIPYGRGNSRSVPIGVLTQQIRLLVDQGVKEIVLTGVDITSYGEDLPGMPTLGQMIKRILAQVPELKRLRLSSLDPVEIDEDLWLLIREEERLLPHLHMSLQAGDNLILKRMKRRHLREDAIRFCEKAKALRPDMLFGADLIAGFPTETEDMFQNTLRIVDECKLTFLHVFPFSPREGTPAARMPQVDPGIVKERAARLRQKGTEALNNTLAQYIGKEVQVLFESPHKGHTNHFVPFKTGGHYAVGEVKSFVISSIEEGALFA